MLCASSTSIFSLSPSAPSSVCSLIDARVIEGGDTELIGANVVECEDAAAMGIGGKDDLEEGPSLVTDPP